jgi:6-pyruvoyltetrahydropterin/6-carboxytetrahydropterin synthase
MNYELTQEFYFDSAHTLDREVETVPSRRVHGHSYHAEVTVSGVPDLTTGMLMDLAILRRAISDLRERLDHRMLNEIDGLGAPTLENLCRFVLTEMRSCVPSVSAVTIARRASGDRCTLRAIP